MGGKSDKTTTTQSASSNPWEPAQNALKGILNQAGALNAKGTQYAPGTQVVPFSGDTLNAMQGIRDRATGGNPLYTQGGQGLAGGLSQAMSTANGDFLNNNPHLSQMFGALSGGVQDAVNSQFSQYGRTGSPAHAGVMTQQLGNLGAQIYGQNYANERSNQMQAVNQLQGLAGMIPGYAEAGYNDLNRLGALGSMQEAKTGEGLTEDFNRYMYNQQSPWDNLQNYGSLAGAIGGMGGTSTGTATEKKQTSTLGSLMSVLTGGAGAYKAFGFGGK